MSLDLNPFLSLDKKWAQKWIQFLSPILIPFLSPSILSPLLSPPHEMVLSDSFVSNDISNNLIHIYGHRQRHWMVFEIAYEDLQVKKFQQKYVDWKNAVIIRSHIIALN